MINYSFIIPHHNCPELLDRCLRSIPQREDLEIIVVDDNSDIDKQPKIQRADAKVVYIDKEHTKGAGRARNVGVSVAKGKWLLFADADDYFTDYLSSLLEKYLIDDSIDIVYLNACVFNENGQEKPHKTEQLILNYIKGKKDSEMHLRYDLWTPWSRMIKRSIVIENNILFDEIPAGNDMMFCLKCSKYANQIAVEQEVVYKYFKSIKGSITDKARMQMIELRLNLRGRMIEFYRDVNYKNSVNFFSLLVLFKQQGAINMREAICMYKRFTKQYNVLVISDIIKYCRRGIKYYCRDKNYYY